MIQLLRHFVETHPCAYLAGKTAQTEYLILDGVSPHELEELLERGWRRFGRSYFRPVCRECRACESLRIPIDDFRPSKHQRRAARKCEQLRVEIGTPQIDQARIDLYREWHSHRASHRDWPQSSISKAEYAEHFCVPDDHCAREMTYYLEDELVAVGIVDRTTTALSSVFFYFSPKISMFSPGTGSILREIKHARDQGLTHLYLGYSVKDCPSMTYKSSFRPHELLMGHPISLEKPVWDCCS